MRVISYILFSLSLLVIMAHDLVPHVHEGDLSLTEDIVTLPETGSHNSTSNLANLLGQYKHNAATTALTSTAKAEKKVDAGYDISFFYLPGSTFIQHGTLWYSNLKKQRFWKEVNVSCHFVVYSISHRGPPAIG